MKHYFIIAIAIVTYFLFATSCDAPVHSRENISTSIPCFNVCVTIDGTDRLDGDNGIPLVTVDELVDIANLLSDLGKCTLYCTYVDKECDNNSVAIFEWMDEKPQKPAPKNGYTMVSQYNEAVAKYESNLSRFNEQLKTHLDVFSMECKQIVAEAYSDAVAKQKKGSDVTGAINAAARLLRASDSESVNSFIILVSDGVDNVGKTLKPIPDNYELIIVNTNVTKHQYGDKVREYATLKQAIDHISK